MISEEADKSRSDLLKQSIVEYFSSDNPTENYTVPEKVSKYLILLPSLIVCMRKEFPIQKRTTLNKKFLRNAGKLVGCRYIGCVALTWSCLIGCEVGQHQIRRLNILVYQTVSAL